MKIDSIRYRAFATNSSSVHTPIIVTNGTPEDCMVNECEFGWQAFIASSEEARRKYIGTALSDQLSTKDFELRKTIVQRWAGVEIEDGYIDHQSMPVIPCRFGTTTPHRDYFINLLKWFTQKGLVIIGGNDNLSEDDPNEAWLAIDDIKKTHNGRIVKFPYPKDQSAKGGRIICRFDRKGFYTLFDRFYGTKIRMSFRDAINMEKSTYPELVDLKITDRCSKGCSYCYQASVPNGSRASYGDICSIIKALAELEVFELAIGGGEPTLHPDFLNILTYAGERGITPSFSTRNLSWFTAKNVEIFKKFCGAFAYSIDSASDIEALEKVSGEFNLGCAYGKHFVTLQFVLKPTTTQKDLDEIFEKNKNYQFPLTLLGWKPIGRAAGSLTAGSLTAGSLTAGSLTAGPLTAGPLTAGPLTAGSLTAGPLTAGPLTAGPLTAGPLTAGPVGFLGELRCDIDWARTFEQHEISIDTAVANLYKEEIAKLGVADWSYKILEGAHSMYIDAVAKKMGPSSYCPKNQYVSCKAFSTLVDEAQKRTLIEEITEAFKIF
jgi:organic radical activating enzyme